VHRGERREPETAADFLEARRVAVLLDEIVEVIEDFPLTFGQRQHAAIIRKGKAKVNAHLRLTFAFRRQSKRVRHAYDTRMELDITRARQ
jgi:hypothetical protein